MIAVKLQLNDILTVSDHSREYAGINVPCLSVDPVATIFMTYRYISATYLATVHYIFGTNRQETTRDIDVLVLCMALTNDRRSCVCVVCAQCQDLQ